MSQQLFMSDDGILIARQPQGGRAASACKVRYKQFHQGAGATCCLPSLEIAQAQKFVKGGRWPLFWAACGLSASPCVGTVHTSQCGPAVATTSGAPLFHGVKVRQSAAQHSAAQQSGVGCAQRCLQTRDSGAQTTIRALVASGGDGDGAGNEFALASPAAACVCSAGDALTFDCPRSMVDMRSSMRASFAAASASCIGFRNWCHQSQHRTWRLMSDMQWQHP